MDIRIEIAPALSAAGLRLRTDNAAEADPAQARIPAHWARFHAGPRPEGPVIGIYGAYEEDHRAPYCLWAAVANPQGPLPQGFEALDLPPRRVLVLELEGNVPEVFHRAWAAVWAHIEAHPHLRRAYTWDVERVEAGPEGKATVRLEISLH